MKKVDDQRKELDQKTHTIMAIQRNFEGLSVMLKKEKEMSIENKRKVGSLTEENAKLAEEKAGLYKR